MQVDEKTVRRIARLARIKVTDEEVKLLDEVETKNVAPMTSTVAMKLRRREDKVTDGEKAEEVTQNAPMREDNFFVVPKVVE
jgi:aspartyl-tRNA(Asn)/glutamyl-tRNA(Gln) amidotransferase subunit C